jgi:hypothetical protein
MRVSVGGAIVIVIAVGWLSAACLNAAVGKKFNTDHVKDVQVGRTTVSDVRNWFGEPLQLKVIPGARRQEQWEYGFGESDSNLVPVLLKVPFRESTTTATAMTILFDQGVVASCTVERITEQSGMSGLSANQQKQKRSAPCADASQVLPSPTQ